MPEAEALTPTKKPPAHYAATLKMHKKPPSVLFLACSHNCPATAREQQRPRHRCTRRRAPVVHNLWRASLPDSEPGTDLRRASLPDSEPGTDLNM